MSKCVDGFDGVQRDLRGQRQGGGTSEQAAEFKWIHLWVVD